jgi:iron complex outermembrane receptor protein
MKRHTLLLLLLIISISYTWAQNTVSGKVTSQKNEELIGVNISVKDISGLGTSTDFNGDYQISLPQGCHDLLFQYIGYKDLLKNVCLEQNKNLNLDVSLKEASEVLGTVVISAGKFEQKLEEVTVSMDVIKPALIENKTATSLDRTMNQSPSVHIVDGQANIRSGSGWSYGAGSRVMVMVDGMPLMNGDQGGVEWQLVPMENISQIEVIKGASSVLFGSSALNGTINIRTAYPTSEPINKLMITHTVYGEPRRKGLHWYNGDVQDSNNYSFLHAHKNKHSDFVLGLNLFNDAGFQEGVTSKRARININKTFYSKNIPGLQYGVKTNFMRSNIGDAIMWMHDTLAYTPLDNDPGFYNNGYVMIDPFMSYHNEEKNIKYIINSRYFHKFYGPFNDETLGEIISTDSTTFSRVAYTDFQVQKIYKEGLSSTSGYTIRIDQGSDENVYGNHININNSLYTQVDYKKDRLNLSLGGRYEHFQDARNTISRPIFRGGANYRVGLATFLRASFGQGIRFPSMLERYVNYETGPMTIFPNENLNPETGWSSELGIKQVVKIGDWKGFIDVAAFVMQYNDMMEFSFGKWGADDEGQLFGFGFKSVNIGNSRIEGVEVSIAGEGQIGKTKIQLLGGYTYTNPYIEDTHQQYDEFITYKTEFNPDLGTMDTVAVSNPISYHTTSSDTSGVLKYRYKHLAKFDINIERNRTVTGFSLRFNSKMDNIDIAFIEPLFDLYLGTTSAWNRLNKNCIMVDYRIGYDITEDARLSLNIDNIFNTEQSLRPAALSAPRTYSVLLKLLF